MRTFPVFVLVCLVSAGVLSAAEDFDPRDFGAAADGATKDTCAIQKAINAAHAAGGGRVVFRKGTFLSGSLFLRSGVELHFAADGRLLGSADPQDYDRRPALRHADSSQLPRYDGAALVTADECERIALTGTGVIDCNGRSFVELRPDKDWSGWRYRRRTDRKPPPRVVMLLGCRDVTVRDLTMTNQPAGWSYWVNDCDRVTFERVKILADVRYPNNDGIHINASRDVSVSDCEIETGDDSVVVRANCAPLHAKRPCERVSVRNCRLRSFANGIRMGWVNDGVIRHVAFRNIDIRDSATGIAFVLPAPASLSDVGIEATRIEDVVFENVTMTNLYAHPLICRVAADRGTKVDAVRNVAFRNVRCHGLEFPFVEGRADAVFRDFRFVNCRFDKVSEAAMPEARWDRQGAAAWDRQPVPRFVHADDFKFENTTFNSP